MSTDSSSQPDKSHDLGRQWSYSFRVQLQASRNGNDADGRQYTITCRVVDDEGMRGQRPPIGDGAA